MERLSQLWVEINQLALLDHQALIAQSNLITNPISEDSA